MSYQQDVVGATFLKRPVDVKREEKPRGNQPTQSVLWTKYYCEIVSYYYSHWDKYELLVTMEALT